MRIEQLPVLGVGLGFREPYRTDLFLHRDEVDFLEITADHYLESGKEKEQELNLLKNHFTLIPHGLNLSLGSAEGLHRRYAHQLARLIQQLQPPWWSEHIAFTRAGGVEIGHLAPLPYTREVIDIITGNIVQMRQFVGDIPLILENITYMVEMPGSEMGQGEFLTRLLEQADCGLLLDVTNLYTNAINHGHDLEATLNELPLERVVQLHFAGGFWDGEVLIDSHSQPVPFEVWELLDEILARAPVKGAILERDDNLPPFREVLTELQRARQIGRSHKRWD